MKFPLGERISLIACAQDTAAHRLGIRSGEIGRVISQMGCANCGDERETHSIAQFTLDSGAAFSLCVRDDDLQRLS